MKRLVVIGRETAVLTELSEGQVLLLAREVAETADIRSPVDLFDWQRDRLVHRIVEASFAIPVKRADQACAEVLANV